jgi:tetratricopeptide (TPR) repeat protein
LTAGAIWGVVRERRAVRDAVCHGAERELVGVWDPERRVEVEKAFRAAPNAPYVETTLQAVQDALGAYAKRWTQTHTEVCEATRVRGDQSEALLDERMECLEDRRRELSSLVHELTAASPHAVEVGVQAVDALSSVETCAGRRAGPSTARDPVKAAERDALRDAIARAQAKMDVGDGEQALSFVREVLPRLRAMADGRLIAEAQLVFGRGASGKELKPAEDALLESEWAFEGLGDDDGVARALLRLVPLRGTLMADAAAAERDERMAQATLTRLGSPADLEADLLVGRASRLLYSDEEGAKLAAQQALATLSSRGLGEKLLASVAFGIIGTSCIDRGDNVCARASFEQALRIRERLSGPSHPMSLLTKADLALVDSKQGRQREAVAEFDEVLAGLDAAGRAKTYEAAMAHTGRGWALTRLGSLPQAKAAFERATQIDRDVEGDHPWTAASLAFVGLVQRLQGDPKAALVTYQQASDVLGRAKTTDPSTEANILAGRGAAQLALGHAAAARPTLETALATYDGTSFEPPERADAAFALARALHALHQDGDRTRSLAESARDGYATNLAVYADEHGEVERFIATLQAP